MCLDAGRIQGNKKNQFASYWSQHTIPCKIIQERTGHRSLAALWQYECTTDEQYVAVSERLAGNEHCGLEQVMIKKCPQPEHL